MIIHQQYWKWFQTRPFCPLKCFANFGRVPWDPGYFRQISRLVKYHHLGQIQSVLYSFISQLRQVKLWCTPRCTQSHAVESFVRISQVAVVLPDRSAAVGRSKLLDCFLRKCPVAQVEAPFLLRFLIQQELGIDCEWSPKIARISNLKSAKRTQILVLCIMDSWTAFYPLCIFGLLAGQLKMSSFCRTCYWQRSLLREEFVVSWGLKKGFPSSLI